MKKYLLIPFIIVLIFVFIGCTTVYLDTGAVNKRVCMTNEANEDFKIVKHFSKELRGWFTVFNLVTISNPDVQKLIQNELLATGGDAVINVKIKGQTTFVDGLIPAGVSVIGSLISPYGFALGYLIGARTYTIEGDVIKYQ